jgi:hypothetical protein
MRALERNAELAAMPRQCCAMRWQWLRTFGVALIVIGSVQSAFAQRVQFPTTSPSNPFATSAPPSTFTPNTGVPSLTTPAYTNPYSSAPQLAPTWDPYALPGSSAAPPPALPAYGTQPAQPNLGFPYRDWTAPQTKLVQGVGMRYTWIRRGGGADGFGVQDVDLTASLAFPFFFNPNMAPLLFTPGFSFHFFQGPGRAVPADIPPTVYDAYGQLSWKPQFTERLGADLALSLGVYSDFSYTDHTSLRLLGRGVGTWQFSPNLQGVLGVVYLDRLDIKILPVAGVIWKPHDDARFELLFPQPKLAQRIVNWNNYDIWGYVAGEYGGGQWAISHANGARDVINYNDFRILLGFEANGQRLKAHFDVGYVFHREILYISGQPPVDAEDSVMLRAGFTY